MTTLRLERLLPAKDGKHKYIAVFLRDGKEFRVAFGAAGYEDYTIHQDKQRRVYYRTRHKGDRIDEPLTPGALSWHLLWGPSTSLNTNLSHFRRRFGL